tara:strand:- start:3370 stop:5229 length:1860 start_codon:yes stop_codon:yes gene_type:complete
MKGQNRIKRGSGFRGVLSYVLDHDEPEYIGGTLPIGSLNQMTREFVLLANTRNDIQKPVWHNSLRLPAGEHITNKTWNQIATDYMEQLRFDESAQWIAFKHNKADGEHIHIIANRVLPTGFIYLGQNENLKSTQIISELEKKYNLTVTKSVGLDDNNKIIRREKSMMKKSEQEKMSRTGQLSERVRLQHIIDDAIEDNPTITEFVEQLNSGSVIATPNIATTGRMNGFSFALKDGDLAFSGSKLGRKYTWSNLLEAGLQYDPESDAAFLGALKRSLSNTVLDNDESNTLISLANSASIKIGEAEKRQLQDVIDRDYVKRDNQYFSIATGKLAFTEETNRIICHEVTPQAIAAQTKLAKIKFGNEFISRGSEAFRRESWLQAAVHGCLDHGYQPNGEDITELKRRLSELESKPALHEKIAVLLESEGGSSGDILQANDPMSELDNIQLAIKEKELELQEIFKQRKAISSQSPTLSDEDRSEIKKRAYQSAVPIANREKIATARKKVRELKSKIDGSNSLFEKFQLNRELKNAGADLSTSKQAINTPDLVAEQKSELARITQEAEQHYQTMRLRKRLELGRIDEQSDAITNELESLEKQRSELAMQLNSDNEASKTSKHAV